MIDKGEAMKRVLDAAAIDNPEALMPKPDPMAALMIEATARPVGQAQTFLPGAVLAASQTTPQAIAGDFRLQQVRISQFGPMVGTEPYVNVVLDARSTVGIDLFDLLGTLS
jgi:hypothetical protein